MKKLISILLAVCLLLPAFSLTAFAADFSGGNGSTASPYVITNAAQLDKIRNNLSAHYVLGATIDLASIQNFKPIGTLNRPFKGSLTAPRNSKGVPAYCIVNLKQTIEKTAYAGAKVSGWEAGLFGCAENAKLENIYIFNAVIVNHVPGRNSGALVYGNYNPGQDEMASGILAGFVINNTQVKNCAASGSVKTDSNWTGGLIGMIESAAVTHSWTTANIDCSGFWNIGGFTGGILNATVDACYAGGYVHHTGESGTCGGFVGAVSTDSRYGKPGTGVTISNCYSTGETSASGRNFVGRTDGGSLVLISDCYTTSNINSKYNNRKGDLTTLANDTENCFAVNVNTNVTGWGSATVQKLQAAFAKKSAWDTSVSPVKLKDMQVFSDPKLCVADPGTKKPVTNQPSSVTASTDSAGSDTVSSNTTVGSEQIEKFRALLNKLPEKTEDLTVEHISIVSDAKKLLESFDDATYSMLENTEIGKINDAVKALQTIIVAYIVDELKAIPAVSEMTESDKEKITQLYEYYNLLDDESKTFISEKNTKKLLEGYEKFKSSGDADAESISQSFYAQELSSTDKAVIAVLLVLICFVLAMHIYLTMVIIKKRKKNKNSAQTEDIYANSQR